MESVDSLPVINASSVLTWVFRAFPLLIWQGRALLSGMMSQFPKFEKSEQICREIGIPKGVIKGIIKGKGRKVSIWICLPQRWSLLRKNNTNN